MSTKNKNPYEIVATVLKVKEETITPDSGYGISAGWDSMNHLEIFTAFETEYNITIPDESIEKYTTMEEIISYLKDSMQINW